MRWGARRPPLQLVRIGSVLSFAGMAGFGWVGAIDGEFSFEMHLLAMGLFGLGLGLLLPGNAAAITLESSSIWPGSRSGTPKRISGIRCRCGSCDWYQHILLESYVTLCCSLLSPLGRMLRHSRCSSD